MPDNEVLMTTVKEINPIKRITQTLRGIRGENTHQLVEAFTSEMTLVAEGLCEDQAKLRTDVENLIREQEKLETRSGQEYGQLTEEIERQSQILQKRMDALEARISTMEKNQEIKRIKLGKWHFSGSFMHQLTIMVIVGAGAWVLVTLMHLIQSVL